MRTSGNITLNHLLSSTSLQNETNRSVWSVAMVSWQIQLQGVFPCLFLTTLQLRAFPARHSGSFTWDLPRFHHVPGRHLAGGLSCVGYCAKHQMQRDGSIPLIHLSVERFEAFSALASGTSSGWCWKERDMATERGQKPILDIMLGSWIPVQFGPNPNGMRFYEEKVSGRLTTLCHSSIKSTVLTQAVRWVTVYWLSTSLSQHTDIQTHRHTDVQTHRYLKLTHIQHVLWSRFIPYWQVAKNK